MKRFYFANNISKQPLPEVVDAMLPYIREHFVTPIYPYQSGQMPKKALEGARSSLASLLNTDPESLIFTSSCTESNCLALFGIARAHRRKSTHLIISAIEHLSVHSTAKALKKEGFNVSFVGVNKEGFVNEIELEQKLRDDTVLVSVIHGSPEACAVQNLDDIVAIAHKKGAMVHSDGSTVAGILPVDIKKLDIDAYTLSSQAIYGPAGTSVLFIKPMINIQPLMYGETQEGGRRPGHHNVAAIAGIGKAAELALAHLEKRYKLLVALRNKAMECLKEAVPHGILIGPLDLEKRLPDTVTFMIEGIESEGVLVLLNELGIEAESSSICTAFANKASHVMKAMGYTDQQARSCLQFSFSIYNNLEEIEYLGIELPNALSKVLEK